MHLTFMSIISINTYTHVKKSYNFILIIGDVFTIDDMDKHCNVCEDLANIIKPHFPQHTEVFLRTLEVSIILILKIK